MKNNNSNDDDPSKKKQKPTLLLMFQGEGKKKKKGEKKKKKRQRLYTSIKSRGTETIDLIMMADDITRRLMRQLKSRRGRHNT